MMIATGAGKEGCVHQSQSSIVAIAGSAGGLDAMCKILPCLPDDFPAPIVYLQHLSGSYNGSLAKVLQWHTTLNVRWARQGERLEAGVVYLCPPGGSSFVQPDGILTLAEPVTTIDHLHPADNLFASVAASYAHRAVVIVLSGAGSDGSDGVSAVRASNGTVLVQQEASASQRSMPRAAVATGCVDFVLRLEDIAPVLLSLMRNGHPLGSLRVKAARFAERKRMYISPGLQDKAERLLSIALGLHGTGMGNIQLLEPGTNNLRIIAQRGFGLDFLDHFAAVNTQNGSACGRAMLNRKPVMIPDVKTDPLFVLHLAIAEAAGFRAVQSTPLSSRDGAFLGVLSTHFRTPGPLQPAKLHWLNWHRRANELVNQLSY